MKEGKSFFSIGIVHKLLHNADVKQDVSIKDTKQFINETELSMFFFLLSTI